MSAIDFSNWKFRSAPLSFLNYRGISIINDLNSVVPSGYAPGSIPYYKNMVTLLNSSWIGATGDRKGSFVGNTENTTSGQGSFSLGGLMGGVAPFRQLAADNIPNLNNHGVGKDPVIYFEWQTLNQYAPREDYGYYTPGMFNTLANRKAPRSGTGSSDFFKSRLGAIFQGIFHGGNDTPDGLVYWEFAQKETEIDNPDDWIVVTRCAVMDFLTDEDTIRKYYPGEVINNNWTTPAAAFTLGKVSACYNLETSIGTTFPMNGLISMNVEPNGVALNSLTPSNVSTMLVGSPIYTAMCHYELGVAITPPSLDKPFQIENPIHSDKWKTIMPLSRSDSRVHLTGKNTGALLQAVIHTQQYDSARSDIAYLDVTKYAFNTTKSKQVLIAFKGVEAAIEFFKEWGFAATDDYSVAQSMQTEFFPGEIGFVPDGGNQSGYPTNNVPHVPSNPDNTSDIIERVPPQISTLSALNAYALNLQECKLFFKFLITDTFVKNISELFNDKLSAVNALKMFPFDIVLHDTSHTYADQKLTVGNVESDISTTAIVDNYNTWIYGGSIIQLGYYGNYNDYINTSYSLYVPFAGIIDLPSDRVVNCQIDLWYAVDLLSGNATAVVYSDGVFIKTIPAQMGMEVPITYTNSNQQLINASLSALNIGSNLFGSIGGGVAAMAIGDIGGGASTISGGLNGAITNGIKSIVTNPKKTGTIGSISSNTAYSLPQQPFLIISRDRIAIPSSYSGLVGKPSIFSGTIGQFIGAGFVSVKNAKLTTSATESERAEILGLLESGIFV